MVSQISKMSLSRTSEHLRWASSVLFKFFIITNLLASVQGFKILHLINIIDYAAGIGNISIEVYVYLGQSVSPHNPQKCTKIVKNHKNGQKNHKLFRIPLTWSTIVQNAWRKCMKLHNKAAQLLISILSQSHGQDLHCISTPSFSYPNPLE